MPRLKADWINPKPRKVTRTHVIETAQGKQGVTETVICAHERYSPAPLKPDIFVRCDGCGVKFYRPGYHPKSYLLEETMYHDDLVARGGVTAKAQKASLWDEATIAANTKTKTNKCGKAYTPRAPKHFNQAVAG